MNDGQIIELFFRRDESAVKELSEKYGSACKRVATNILRDSRDADECINDAYLGVWCTIPPKRPEKLAAYLLKIVRNTAAKRYHANTAAKRNSFYDTALDELCDTFSASDNVEKAVEIKETINEINSFLESIDKPERIMFVKRYYFAEAVSDIARDMNKSAHYVSVKLSRVRARMKKHMIQKGITL